MSFQVGMCNLVLNFIVYICHLKVQSSYISVLVQFSSNVLDIVLFQSGTTPLSRAASWGQGDVVKTLIEAGANNFFIN